MTSAESVGAVTKCLREWTAGDESAIDRLAGEVYRELHRLSRGILSPHKPDVILQPTVLLHEFYLRLPKMKDTDWRSRAQFFNTAARMMRNILVDHARSRRAVKRGGEAGTLTVDNAFLGTRVPLDVLAVHEALAIFTDRYPRHARCVELRFFGGLTAEEIVEAMRLDGTEYSLRTAERDWSFSKAWLQNYLGSV